MKIAILGTGGVGGYFGAKLVQAGNDVSFLARGAHLRAIQKSGLKVKSILGDFQVSGVKATDKIAELKNSELILICVKAWQVKEIRDDLKTIVDSNTVVLPLQNGVLAAEELSETIPKGNIVGGLCRIISKVDSPGVINHFGVQPSIVFGEFNGEKTERVQSMDEVFRTAGITSRISNAIETDLWKKFIAICVSGLLAVTNTTYGELREIKETRELMIGLLDEIFMLSKSFGVNLEEDFVEKTVSFIDTFPYDSTSSLTRDVWAKKPSELYYQNGAVVRLGDKVGVDTPINRFVYTCLLPGELRSRGTKVLG